MTFKRFDYNQDFAHIDFRKHPDAYQVGIGEQGVLLVEPYKSEILPFWKFKTPAIARESSRKIFSMFIAYKKQGDFAGMDMARKFLQMGWTRSRRYANHKGGRKYDARGKVLPRTSDPQKAESARIFYKTYLRTREDEGYKALKAKHRERYEMM